MLHHHDQLYNGLVQVPVFEGTPMGMPSKSEAAAATTTAPSTATSLTLLTTNRIEFTFYPLATPPLHHPNTHVRTQQLTNSPTTPPTHEPTNPPATFKLYKNNIITFSSGGVYQYTDDIYYAAGGGGGDGYGHSQGIGGEDFFAMRSR